MSLALLVLAAAAHANSIILASHDAAIGERDLWIEEDARSVQLGLVGGINATVDGQSSRVLWVLQAIADIALNPNFQMVIDFADTPPL